MKVLFIIHDNHQDDNEFPLGPAYLAAVLRKNNIDVDIYCMDVYHYTNYQLAEYLKKNTYDIIGLGFMAARFNETIIDLCKVINKYKDRGWLVLGGHGPSPIPNYMINKTGADAIIIGEAEEVILDIVNDKQNNNNQVIYRNKPTKKLDDLPYPAWDLFPTDRYISSVQLPGMESKDKTIEMVSSRGCINRCSFCYRMENGVRVRKIPYIIEEMEYLNDTYGVTHFQFSDELFVLSKKRLEKFYIAIQNSKLNNIVYWCDARVNIIDDELMDLMKKSGCEFINYGFESMDLDVLKAMKKNTTPEQNENAARITKEYNIPFGLNLIWNNLHDTFETLKQNKEFIMKYNLFGQLRTIRPVTAYPGSDLYYYSIENGLLDGPEDFFNKFKNSDLVHTNFTDLNIKDMYDALYKTNKELIYHHYKNTSGDMKEAEYMAHQFYRLYYEKFYKFRGARHYNKEDDNE